MRVSEHISRFPAHAAQILTSAVIECSKVGNINQAGPSNVLQADMRSWATRLAGQLMRPEYRNKVDEKYKRKLEGIVRC